MNGKRPLIGVTGPDRGGDAAWWFTRFAVWLAGGRAVRITPRHLRTIDHLCGLIIGGGADVDPTLYGQEILHIASAKRRDETTAGYLAGAILFPATWLARKLTARRPLHRGRDARRDELEMRLIDQAVRRRLPILGICRGEQLLNVYFGGTLKQALKGLYVEDPEVRTILPRKRLLVEANSKLATILGPHPQRVNALHSQAIDRLGDGLRVAARDRNGIVQAIEHISLPFVLGVQWHPEYLPQKREQRRIFETLLRHARRDAQAAPNGTGVARPRTEHRQGAPVAKKKFQASNRPQQAASRKPDPKKLAQEQEQRDEENKRRFIDQSGIVAQDLPGTEHGQNAVPNAHEMTRNLPHQHGGKLGGEGALRGDRDISAADDHGGRKNN
ncbi:MAG TPA: type 1 glutamine amidotransferase [Tepidisphaeraceae bacterium]|nr:type 1 glutamine amidotransferase [Tepidisphaeraceae bacterium]